MDFSKILSISGKTGLFKVVSQAKNAVIVESLTDKKRFPAFGNEKISSLEEISVFTTGEDLPLKTIFRTIHEKLEGKPAVDPKSDNSVLKKFFLEMIPEFDQERVYISDIRKIVTWYNLLIANDIVDFSEEKKKSEEGQPEPEPNESAETPPAEAVELSPEAIIPPEETRPVEPKAKKTASAKKAKKNGE